MRLSVFEAGTQRNALLELAKLTQRSTVHPLVRETAIKIVQRCEARDDMCELQAIFDAVKYGTPDVKGFERGIRYVADPNWSDFFTAPNRLIEMAARGAAAGDCDDHAALIAALAGSIGYTTGLRVWGPNKDSGFVHVYAVVAAPKRDPDEVYGMDTTVDESSVGWEPPSGVVLTAWLKD